MFIYLDSHQSLDINRNNTAGKFTVQLPESFSRPVNATSRGQWYLGLVEIAIPSVGAGANKWDVVYVVCPEVEGVTLGDTYRAVLRSIALGEIRRHNYVRFQSVLYTPLRVKDVSHISIELRDSSWNVLPELVRETRHSTKCTLELIWKRDTNR
jgi:hypothetical protein